jgi:hypothetical protein
MLQGMKLNAMVVILIAAVIILAGAVVALSTGQKDNAAVKVPSNTVDVYHCPHDNAVLGHEVVDGNHVFTCSKCGYVAIYEWHGYYKKVYESG